MSTPPALVPAASAAIRRAHRPGLLAIALVAAACADETSEAPGRAASTTDSAGVAVTVSRNPAWSAATAWWIADALSLDIGADGSGITFERVAGVALLEDGGVIVADEGASTVSRFGQDGRLRWRVGRAGDGPGEFRLIASIGTGPADSIWAFDFGLRRFTILTASGAIVRTLDIGSAISAPRAIGRLDDGSFVLQEMWGSGDAMPQTGMRREPAALVRIAADRGKVDTITVRPGREVWLTVEDGRGVMNTPLFSRNTVAAAIGSTIAVGDQALFVIDLFDTDGGLRRSVRREVARSSVDADAVTLAIDATLESLPEAERAERRRFLEAVPLPESAPAFGRIILEPTGRLWVSDYRTVASDRADWHVFDAAGEWLGTVAMPDGFTLEAVVGRRVAGVWRDALDVEHVRTYEIVDPGAG